MKWERMELVRPQPVGSACKTNAISEPRRDPQKPKASWHPLGGSSSSKVCSHLQLCCQQGTRSWL